VFLSQLGAEHFAPKDVKMNCPEVYWNNSEKSARKNNGVEKIWGNHPLVIRRLMRKPDYSIEKEMCLSQMRLQLLSRLQQITQSAN